MNNKFTLLFFSVVSLIVISFLLKKVNNHDEHFPKEKKQERSETKEEEGVSGAGLSLDAWSLARSYPLEKIPTKKLTEGLQIKKRLRPNTASERSSWTPIGPQNFAGRILSITVDPNNPETLYAGSASGGLWKSVNDGTTWNYVATGLPVLGVSSIAVDPDNSNNIYIGTGEVYGDFDPNDSIPNQGTGQGYTIRFRRGTYGIGILKSTDAGLTWNYSLDWSTTDDLKGVNVLKISPFNSDVIYAGTSEGLFYTSDAGQTWSNLINFPNVTDIAMHPDDEGTILVSVGTFESSGYGLYRSTDGINFNQIVFPDFTGKVMLDFSESNLDVAFASVANHDASLGLFKSEDKGLTWSLVNDTDYARYQGWYSHDVAINPNDENRLLVGGINVWRSTNAGDNLISESDWLLWNLSAFPIAGPEQPAGDYVHADIHDIVYHPTISDKVYIACDGGIFKSDNDGLDFVSANTGLQTVQFYQNFSNSMSDENFALGGLQDNATAVYRGDLAWERKIGGDGFGTIVDPTNDNNVWGSLYYMRLFYSKDNGENFFFNTGGLSECAGVDPPDCFCNFSAPISFSPSSGNLRIYAASNKVYRIENGADRIVTNNGSPLDGNNPVNCLGTSSQNADVVYAGISPLYGGSTKMFKSINAGNSWSNITGNLPDRFPMEITVDPCDDNIVYVVFGGYEITSHVYRSDDAGMTWESIGDDLPDLPTNSIFVDPENTEHIYVGNDAGVFVSMDSGQTWETFSNGLPDAVMVMSLSHTGLGRKLRVATHGNGVYETDLMHTAEPFFTTTNNLGVWYDEDFEIDYLDEPTSCIYDLCFYNVRDFDGVEWRSNSSKGFLYEKFLTNNLHPDWNITLGSWQVDNGELFQGLQLEENTAVNIELEQLDTVGYLYEWKMKIAGDALNKRAGIHIFADDLSAANRGNSYLIYFYENHNVIRIFKTDSNGNSNQLLFQEFDIPTDEFLNCKVIYEPSNGSIKVFVDNEIVAFIHDPDPLLNGNGFSLRTGQSFAWFDDITISKSRICDDGQTILVSPTGDCRFESPNDSTYVCGISAIGYSSMKGWNYDTSEVKIGEHLIHLTGTTKTENDEPVQNVTVNLIYNNTLTDVTDANGEFQFELMSSNQGVEIQPESLNDFTNGVTTFDMVLIRKHILGIEALNSPYKIIGADATNDGNITTFDVVQFTRLILQNINELPNNTSWRFVPQSHIFANPLMPFDEAFDESIIVDPVSADRNDLDFIAIKLGDMNGSANLLNGGTHAELRNDDYIYLMLENRKLEKRDEVVVPFFAKDFENVNGYQISFEFDESVLELKNTKTNKNQDLPKESFGKTMIKDGRLLMNWIADEPTSIHDGNALFEFIFYVKKSANLKSVLKISDVEIQSEAYSDENEILKIDLDFVDETEIQLFNIEANPNPFENQFSLSLTSLSATNAEINFYESSGKLLKTHSSSFSEGENKLRIDFNDVSYSGIIFYKIKTQNSEWSGKLLKM